MTRMVKCAKLCAELPGLDYAPFKGELGRRIFESVSADAWKLWLRQSVMIINEYRLNPAEPSAQTLLREHMERFFFGDGDEPPPSFKPQS